MVAAQQMYTTMGFTSTGERHTPDGMDLLGYAFDIESDALANR